MFPTPRYTLRSAQAWAEREGYRTDDVDFSDDMHFIHLRQTDPNRYARVRTKALGDSGVLARVGWKRC
jgi:hypothetical protein